MEASVVVTVLNEEKSIKALLDGLLRQTKKPKEIVVVDGGSTDATASVVTSHQSPVSSKGTKLIFFTKPGFNIARGRNFGINKAKSEIVAITDAGCVPHRNWLEKLVVPFKDSGSDVVAGFYRMQTRTSFQKALAPFLGILPEDFSRDFLPSSRSVAFRKSIWQKVGGYPQNTGKTAEDTVFNVKLIKKGAKIVPVRGALVDWQVPENLWQAFGKFFSYARGDARSGIWWHPQKKLFTHNLKVLSVYARYLFFLGLLAVKTSWGISVPALYLIIWPIAKHAPRVKKDEAIFWLPALQLVSDLGVMLGFLAGHVHVVLNVAGGKRW